MQALAVRRPGGSRGSAVRSGAPAEASLSLSAATAPKIPSSYTNSQTSGGCGEESTSLPRVPFEEPGVLVAAPSRSPSYPTGRTVARALSPLIPGSWKENGHSFPGH